MSSIRAVTKQFCALTSSSRISRWMSKFAPFRTMDSRSASTADRSDLKKTMSEWKFCPSSALESGLPLDPIQDNYIRRNVPGAIYSKVQPTPLVKDVQLVSISADVLINILDMDPSIAGTQEFVDWVSGNLVLDSSTPLAHRYGGYQFGQWAYQLGDGRAISLGEYISRSEDRWEIQLKGSGLTPYSRGADGRAVVRSSVREFLCSEAMHALGVPTSRAAAMVLSKDPVERDQFYDGNPQIEKAAIVMRVAPSWLRIGSLEILMMNRELDELKKLVEHVTKLRKDINLEDEDRYVKLIENVCRENIRLVIDWMRFGFTHGVLNTDNISLFGVTIDYGPFGFMETYNPDFIPNSSDSRGRYSYSNQPRVILWNLGRFAAAVAPLLTDDQIERVTAFLNRCPSLLADQLNDALEKKLGLNEVKSPELYSVLLGMMQDSGCDFTMTFRQLGYINVKELLDPAIREKHWSLNRLGKHESFPEFVAQYQKRMEEEGISDSDRRENILKRNPQYVLRNWMAQQAIAKADKNDFSEVQFILEVLNNPFTVQPEAEKRGFAGPPPTWSCGIRVSCSS